jgi:hypothetical protein
MLTNPKSLLHLPRPHLCALGLFLLKIPVGFAALAFSKLDQRLADKGLTPARVKEKGRIRFDPLNQNRLRIAFL